MSILKVLASTPDGYELWATGGLLPGNNVLYKTFNGLTVTLILLVLLPVVCFIFYLLKVTKCQRSEMSAKFHSILGQND